MSKPRMMVSSDYANLSGKFGSFYYGYESCMCLKCGEMMRPGSETCDREGHGDEEREWCFEANINGIDKIVIPYSKLRAGSDMWDVVNALNIGIAWVLTKYNLTQKER